MTMLALHMSPAGPPFAARFYSGHETAHAVGLSWERFRKVRLAWTRDRDFPAEINEPGEAVRYLADAVDRWLERRSRRVHAVAADPPPLSTEQAAKPDREGKAARAGRSALKLIKGN